MWLSPLQLVKALMYVKNAPQLAVFIRGGVETFDMTLELLDMVPLTRTTSGNELFLHVEKILKI